MALPGFGKASQEILQKARVLIVGAGGLGCPAAQYLAAAGIGTIGIADDDTVSLSNLHRQILYTPDDIGQPKAAIAAKKLQQQNPSVKIIPYHLRVNSENVIELIAGFDLIIEGTDNFETKYLLNDACVLSGKALVYGAIYQYEGQVSIWNVMQKDGSHSANYRDVFPDAENAQVPNCADGGVIPTLAGIVGCMQANEVIKYFTSKENLLAGKLWMINLQDGETHIINLKKATGVKITGLPQIVTVISFDDLQKEDYELIDVRTEAEHRAFNIGGRNIPLNDLEANWDQIDKTRAIVFYCATGNRSADAAGKLKKTFPAAKVYSLKGGINNQSTKQTV
ncbi:MAG: HesA/MoeB/ThiF family protein [Chitinophagaceae bacterium]|nr:HesA/MoeB/ThiF family protein [Chitinophagaceae bacterium]